MAKPINKTVWISTTRQKPWKSLAVRDGLAKASASLRVTDQADQTIDGFGGCFNELGQVALCELPVKTRQEVMRELFGPAGCRFNLCRLPIGASDYAASWYSCNETPGDLAMRHFSIDRDRVHLIPFIKEALKVRPDMELFASPWSPPTWMKNPPVYNYGTLVWTKENLRAYAQYFVKFVQAYGREGIHVGKVFPQNEPIADQKFPSCLWQGGQLLEFIRDYLVPALRQARMNTQVWLGTLNTDDYDKYVYQVLSDVKVRQMIGGVGFQWFGRGAVQRTHESFPAVRLMQSENECGDGENTWAFAKYVFGLMRHYIANGASSYIYWNMILSPQGRSTWGWKQNSMLTVANGKVAYNHEFYVMKHLSGFVDVGATRLETQGELTGHSLAFRNPSGQTVVLVRNALAVPQSVELSAGASCVKVTLPADSINTLVLPKISSAMPT
jgi:glucosylceramidase